MAEGHRWHVRMLALSCGERRHSCRDLGIDPEFVMKTLNQLQVRFELPRKFPEDLVLLVCSGELRVSTRLTIEVAQVLISRKEPKPVANHRAAEICGEVTVLDPLISAERLSTRHWELHRLCG